MTLRFGTDGLRGVANTELTPELVLALGRAAARVLGQKGSPFLIGRDTRLSGPMLEAALAAGMASEGVNVGLLGVLPTPGVAWLSAADGWPAAMISASHNPYADNGVKFFAPGGRKLSDETEKQLEAEVEALGSPGLSGTQVGRVAPCAGVERYQDALVSTLAHRRLDGLRVIVDCANGAASEVAPAVLARAGADVDAIHNRPDGININD